MRRSRGESLQHDRDLVLDILLLLLRARERGRGERSHGDGDGDGDGDVKYRHRHRQTRREEEIKGLVCLKGLAFSCFPGFKSGRAEQFNLQRSKGKSS